MSAVSAKAKRCDHARLTLLSLFFQRYAARRGGEAANQWRPFRARGRNPRRRRPVRAQRSIFQRYANWSASIYAFSELTEPEL
jgi:hypothetical protein